VGEPFEEQEPGCPATGLRILRVMVNQYGHVIDVFARDVTHSEGTIRSTCDAGCYVGCIVTATLLPRQPMKRDQEDSGSRHLRPLQGEQQQHLVVGIAVESSVFLS
jgi:hypothetical protein